MDAVRGTRHSSFRPGSELSNVLSWRDHHHARPIRFVPVALTVALLAGADLSDFFATALRSTDELDYEEALDWYGLRFAAADPADPDSAWTLEVRTGATAEQRQHLDSFSR
jgi:hypothetical protein